MPQLTKIYAKAFDAERKIFLGKDAKLLLLRSDAEAAPFEVKETLSAGWSAYFSEYFQTSTFQVARDTAEFLDLVRESDSLTIIDSTNSALNNSVFDLERDVQPPLGSEPFWKLRAKATGKHYEPPVSP